MVLLNKIFNQKFLLITLSLILVEIFSFFAHFFNLFNVFIWVAVFVLTFVFTWKDLKYGVFIVLAELIIGSQGYLFYLDFGYFKISVRMAIFLAVFIVWLIKYFSVRQWLTNLKQERIIQVFGVLIILILIGVLNGLLRGLPKSEVFFDANGYFYLALLPAIWQVFQNKKNTIVFFQILLAGLFVSGLKVIGLLYFFSHAFNYVVADLYQWVRDTKIAEIAQMDFGFSRIFIQSQIYSLIGLFILGFFLIYFFNQTDKTKKLLRKDGNFINLLIVLTLVVASVLISLSRSFWFGGVFGGIGFLIIIFIYFKNLKREIWQTILTIFLTTILSLAILFGIVKIPWPDSTGNISLDIFHGRFTQVTDEAAVTSRWNLLPPLIEKTKECNFFGCGFATRVKYISEDPRIRTLDNPEGWYSTFTFEWAYLDTVTEIGFLGLLIQLYLIYLIIKKLIYWLKNGDFNDQIIAGGLFCGLLALLVTHFFTPYLNHPLGLGYLMVMIGILLPSTKLQEKIFY